MRSADGAERPDGCVGAASIAPRYRLEGGGTCDWRRPGEHVWETKRVEER